MSAPKPHPQSFKKAPEASTTGRRRSAPSPSYESIILTPVINAFNHRLTMVDELPKASLLVQPPCCCHHGSISSVQWLDSRRISIVCSMLDSIWMEQQGMEAIYTWVEWLQTSSLSFLGIHEEIVLGPYGIKHDGDRRADSRSVSPDVDIPAFRSYNVEQCHANLCRSLRQCCVCYDESVGSDFIRLPC
ncbi:hypothetical protein Tsubulata_021542 [Turnera subulata]|uniref:RWD domain-containing protein n=1 Tax=Turnera subulata TaxID=218843 RepID=A0A9Q0G9B0_9ROSI|nr:hypothetical protein Tsubulata_021542 [Turnera subulata]